MESTRKNEFRSTVVEIALVTLVTLVVVLNGALPW